MKSEKHYWIVGALMLVVLLGFITLCGINKFCDDEVKAQTYENMESEASNIWAFVDQEIHYVEEGIFPMDSRRVLVLEFVEKDLGHYLNDSMVRFAVSRIQLEVREYRCVGVMVDLRNG